MPTRLLRKISCTYLLLLILAGCDSGSPEKDLVILDGPFTDNDAWRNAGNNPLLRKTSERYLHFEGTQYILNFQVTCDTSAAENLSKVALMVHADSVDVVPWMIYYRADFGNQYTKIHPETYSLDSGVARLTELSVSESKSERAQGYMSLNYGFTAENLLFANAKVLIPRIQTQLHECYFSEIGSKSEVQLE